MWKKIPIFLTAALVISTVVFGIIGYQVKQKSYELEAKKVREGQIPKKDFQIRTYGGTDITSLFKLYTDASFRIYMAGKEIKNLYSIRYFFENTGKAPILESDFSKNLTLTFPERWKILVLQNEGVTPPEFNPVWERVNNHKIQLKPMLINAGDKFALEIYLSDIEKGIEKDEVSKKLQATWTVKIPNLSKIDLDDPVTRKLKPKKPTPKLDPKNLLKSLLEEYYILRFGAGITTLFRAGFLIQPYEWGVYAIIALAAIMIFVYLSLLYPLKEHFNFSKQSSIFSIIGVSVFSFAASETYITFFVALGINVALINYIFMFLYVASIIILFWLNGRVKPRGLASNL
ncbi:MAG: hypothetical protein K8R79_07135 [Calditrichales bacterium]|nr:hypothetical protein [Calditrichales bacterium]